MRHSKAFSAILLIVVILLMVQVSAWKSSDFIRDDFKIEKLKTNTNYGKYIFEDTRWYDPFGIWTKYKIKEVTLTNNSDYCEENCFAEKEIILYEEGSLVDDIIFRTLQPDGSWVEQPIRNYEFSYEGDNGRTTYNEGDILPAGTYNLKLDGWKKPSRTVDWIVNIDGVWTDEWAVWNGRQQEVYDNINDSSIDLNLWKYYNESGTTVVENSEYIRIHTDLTGTSQTSIGNITTINLPEIEKLNNISFQTYIRTWSTFLWSGNAYVSLFGNDIENVGSGGTTYDVTKETNWTVYRNSTCGENCFSVFNDGSFQENINSTNNNISLRTFINTGNAGDRMQSEARIYWVNYSLNNIILNSPENNYISASEIVEFNCSANISNGATLTNISLWTNQSGIWEAKNITTGLSTNSTTQTWNRTINDTTLWTCQACDSDGDCGFASNNRTLFLDIIYPLISVESPVGILGSGLIGANETLNVTFTDQRLDSCWYDYNGTNITIDGCLTGVKNSTQFILEANNFNMTIYANDSVGNLNSTLIEWAYNITELSQTYPTSSVESATEIYVANLSYNSSAFSVITGILTLNNTPYIGTKTGVGNNAIFTTNVIMPSVSAETNFTSYWTISLTDESGTIDYNLTSNNVTVSIINLSLCGSPLTVPFWNFTILNESNSVEINSTFEATFSVKEIGSTTANEFSFADTTETNSQYDFCISPTAENYTIDTAIKLTKSGFVDKFYNYQEAIVTNSTRENNLYMMTSGDSTSFIVHVVDVSATDITGAEVKVQRYYSGTGQWVTTEILTTNYVGQAVGHLLAEDADYRFLVYQSGVSIYNSSATKITCAVAPCTVTLVIPIESATGFEEIENLDSTLTYSTTTNIFTYTYSDTSGSFSQARLFVVATFPTNATEVIACNETKTTAAGVITCSLVGKNNGTYQASGYITRTGDEFLDKRIYGTLGARTYDAMGNDGVLWGIFVLIAIVMLGVNRPSLSIVFGAVGLIILWLLEIINIGVVSIISVVSIAIILLMRVGRE
jgi:hypothetical protein